MPRPLKVRHVSEAVGECVFRPAGKRTGPRISVTLRRDEAEAVRLADLQGLYQADAAGHMGVSRQTFGRIVESARRKIADAIINRKCLRIEGPGSMGGFTATQGVEASR
jgi:uncharacterized protein